MVERGPEKAGVGGSIPSLATTKLTTYRVFSPRFHSQLFRLARRDSPRMRGGQDGITFAHDLPVAAPSGFQLRTLNATTHVCLDRPSMRRLRTCEDPDCRNNRYRKRYVPPSLPHRLVPQKRARFASFPCCDQTRMPADRRRVVGEAAEDERPVPLFLSAQLDLSQRSILEERGKVAAETDRASRAALGDDKSDSPCLPYGTLIPM